MYVCIYLSNLPIYLSIYGWQVICAHKSGSSAHTEPAHLRTHIRFICDNISGSSAHTLSQATMVSILLFYLNSPPAFHQTMVSILLLYLNHPPFVPLNHCIHSTSLFKLPPPCVPSNHGLHSTCLFQRSSPCVPLNHCLHSTSLFKLYPPAFHQTIVSILLLYLNFPPLRSTKPWSPFYFLI